MMHRAWSSIVEVPYCFSRSYVKFQGQTALKIVEFDLNWAFPDCNSSLNSPMAMKCCTKLETAKDALLFSKVIHQISRSHGTKHHQFLTKLSVSWLLAGRSFQIPQICLVFGLIINLSDEFSKLSKILDLGAILLTGFPSRFKLDGNFSMVSPRF